MLPSCPFLCHPDRHASPAPHTELAPTQCTEAWLCREKAEKKEGRPKREKGEEEKNPQGGGGGSDSGPTHSSRVTGVDKVSKQNSKALKHKCSLVAKGMATLTQADLLILKFALALEPTHEKQTNK